MAYQVQETKWILTAGREQKSLPPVPRKMRVSARTSYASVFHPCSWNAFSIMPFLSSLSFSWAKRIEGSLTGPPSRGVWQWLPRQETGVLLKSHKIYPVLCIIKAWILWWRKHFPQGSTSQCWAGSQTSWRGMNRAASHEDTAKDRATVAHCQALTGPTVNKSQA